MLLIFEVIFIALIGLNLFWLNSVWLGIAAMIGLILILSRRLHNGLYAIIASISWLMISGAFFYYTYKLTNLTIFISIITLPLVTSLLPHSTTPTGQNRRWFSALLAILSFAGLITVLWLGRTGNALVSPWPEVNSWFFILLFILVIISFIRPSNIANALVFVVAGSVALIIYKNGFGFDPFIHQAAENYIKLHGVITPKTFYYIGHYALVLVASQITTLPINLIDSLLVPIFSGLLLAVAATKQLGKYAALFLILPVGFFTVTTPFAFALALFVILIFIQLENAPTLLQWLLALGILSIHPIVGLPAIFMVVWLNYADKSASRFPDVNNIMGNQDKLPILRQGFGGQANYKLLIAIAGSLVLPVLFLMVGKFTPHWPTLNWPILFDRRYDFWLELIHIFELLILPAVIIGGLIITFKRFKNHFWAFLIVATSGLLVKTTITFPNLISYEQNNFADRILWLSVFIVFIPLLIWLKEKISNMSFSSRLSKGLLFTFLAVLIIFGTYLSYPRRDVYSVSKGWSVGDTDQKAVRLIEQDAGQIPYIVLANQATAAAALETFGFRYIKSNNDEFFFYPIPTSGQLYQDYLDVVYNQGGREALLKAIKYAGVTQGYFAISDYWWDAQKIKTSAKLWADSWFDVDDGKITVFKIKSRPTP